MRGVCLLYAQQVPARRAAQRQAVAHLRAVVGLTPYRAPMALQVMPTCRARRTLTPLLSVKFSRTIRGRRIKASAHAMAQVIGFLVILEVRRLYGNHQPQQRKQGN
jgi:hypothetical protein